MDGAALSAGKNEFSIGIGLMMDLLEYHPLSEHLASSSTTVIRKESLDQPA